MSETATVYVTRYALSGGIQKVSGTISGEVFRPEGRGWNSYNGEGRDWHRTAEGAVAYAGEMAIAKTASLQRSIDKIKKTDFGKQIAKADAAHAAAVQEP